MATTTAHRRKYGGADWRKVFDLSRANENSEPIREPDASLISPAGKSLLFVIPAWRRVELSSICFEQQADCLQQLRAQGIDAHALVIADDDNLEAAERAGLETVRARNRLGEKLNRGYLHAAKQGFDYVAALGSDSWISPDRFALLPGEGTILCTRNYTCVSGNGEHQGWFRIDYDAGVGTRIFPTGLLARCAYKPVEPARMQGCDTATLNSICRSVSPALVYTDFHPYEIVGFQSDTQITPYSRMVERFETEWQKPFQGLTEHYPRRLVNKIKAYYREAAANA